MKKFPSNTPNSQLVSEFRFRSLSSSCFLSFEFRAGEQVLPSPCLRNGGLHGGHVANRVGALQVRRLKGHAPVSEHQGPSRRQVVVSINGGTPIYSRPPKYYDPCYVDRQKSIPNFGKPPCLFLECRGSSSVLQALRAFAPWPPCFG